MALNFTKSNTFTPNSLIESSKVNQDFDEIAQVFQGLEAGTKSMLKLPLDANPTSALHAAPKQYVDNLNGYRRPVLTYVSATTVDVENNTGSSNQTTILFPDGDLRSVTENTSSTHLHRRFIITATASQTATYDSGMRGGESEADNTWYAIYACKTTDDSSKFVLIGSVAIPVQSNIATLNSYFGTNSWVFLGMIRNGDNLGTAEDILSFYQAGNTTYFSNVTNASQCGIGLAYSASSAALQWAYASGIGAAQVPSTLIHGKISSYSGATTGYGLLTNSANNRNYGSSLAASTLGLQIFTMAPIGLGFQFNISAGASTAWIHLASFTDVALGVGANPLL